MAAMAVDDIGPFGPGIRAPESNDTNGEGHGPGKATPASKDAIRKSLRDVIR